MLPYLQAMQAAFPRAKTAVVASDENRKWNRDVLSETTASAATVHFCEWSLYGSCIQDSTT
jgi:hypothetical protein